MKKIILCFSLLLSSPAFASLSCDAENPEHQEKVGAMFDAIKLQDFYYNQLAQAHKIGGEYLCKVLRNVLTQTDISFKLLDEEIDHETKCNNQSQANYLQNYKNWILGNTSSLDGYYSEKCSAN